MGSPRKRIGFLPRTQVQEIIDQLCMEENLSQSKVVGILVEEALAARGIFDPTQGRDCLQFQGVTLERFRAFR